MNYYSYKLFLPGGVERIVGYQRPVEVFYELLKRTDITREQLTKIADDLRYGDTSSLEEL